jgi:hypothetical protein
MATLKFTSNHCTHHHVACMNYIYILLALCTFICMRVDVPRCVNVVVVAICSSLKFNHQETVVYMFTQLWKRRGVDAVQKAVINMYFNSDLRKTQEVGTVVPRN